MKYKTAPAGEPRTSFLHELKTGFSYINKHAIVAYSLFKLFVSTSALAVVSLLAISYAKEVLMIGEKNFGYLVIAAGLGMFCGLGFLGRVSHYFRTTTLVIISFFISGFTLFMISMTSDIKLSLVLIFILGVGNILINSSIQTILQSEVPVEVRGRVFGVQNMLINSAFTFPLIIFGGIADVWGIRPALCDPRRHDDPCGMRGDLRKRVQNRIVRPLACNYFLTLRCNDTCEFCGVWQNKGNAEIAESGTASVKDNLRELKKLGVYVVNFTGGEPLLRDDLPEILQFSKKLGFFNILTTNGILFEEKAEKITPLADHLVFSLDSPVAEEHDRIRGTSCYQAVMDGIKAAKGFGILPMINFTITRDTVTSLPEMADLCHNLGVLLWINPVYNWSGLEGFEKSSLDYISRYFGSKDVALNLASLKVIREGGNRVKRPVCRAGDATVTILPDNTLAVPCFNLQKAALKIENGLINTIKRREVMQAASLRGKDPRCEGCMDWSYLNPSFLRVVNSNLFPALHSIWSLFWKELRLKSRLQTVPAGRKEKI